MASQPPNVAVENLRELALFISWEVRDALTAGFVTFVADKFFDQYDRPEQEHRFSTNPANTLPYRALRALEERAVVIVAEVLHDEHDLRPTTAAIRRLDDIRLHRHALSHPATVQWRNRAMHAFADTDRAYADYRPALLWDLQRSINEELRAHGQPTENDNVSATYEMAVMLHTILNLARLPESAPIPDAAALLTYLHAQAATFTRVLERRPDGRR